MTKEKKQQETNVEQPKQEVKFPQIASELRGNFTVFTKEKGAFRWDFPYKSTLDDTSELLAILKEAVDKTIRERDELEKKKAKEEAESNPNKENKTEKYTPVK